jgi:uncharacterized RDD family membrane protein YckC
VSHEYYTCPLCEQPRKARSFKPIYGQLACTPCRMGLVSKRQWAWALDIIALHLVYTALTFSLTVRGVGVAGSSYVFALAAFFGELLFDLAFMSKDGLFAGQSPGKWLMGLRTVRVPERSPIGLTESFRRNLPFVPSLALCTLSTPVMVIQPGAVGAIAGILGRLAWYATILLVSAQLPRGPRWGDRYAQTRVVPVRYENHPFFTQSPNCEGCGYDLRGTVSPSCPECGRPLSEMNLAALGRNLA